MSSDPLTTSFESVPAEHDGSRAFSFRVRFSEDVKVRYRVLRDEAFIVSGGTVTQRTTATTGGRSCCSGMARTRSTPRCWRRRVATTPGRSVSATAGRCGTARRQRWRDLRRSAGPQVGERLQASTSGIADADRLDGAAFAYQWIRGREDIGGATGSSYRLVDADEGERIKVRVTFTDDARNDES